MMCFAARGREGFDKFEKGDFQTFVADDGFRYIRLVVKRKTKTNQSKSQNLNQGGSIPYELNAFGVSPGAFFDDFVKKLHPDSQYLLQRPKRSMEIYEKNDLW